MIRNSRHAIDDLIRFMQIAVANEVVLAERVAAALRAEFDAGRDGIGVLEGRLELGRELLGWLNAFKYERAILEDGLRMARYYGRLASQR